MVPTDDVQAALPAGPYILTANGELGAYDALRQLHVDEPLSRAFAAHNHAFLSSYRNGAQASDHRIAILYNAREPRAWGRLTLSLEDVVVRDLYPTSGRVAGELTAFQQKSREQSLYRGMELLLDYRRESAPGLPVFCPVLFSPQTTLAERGSALGREPGEPEREIPVIDVLNLAATVPAARRDVPAIFALVEKLRQGVIRKDQRRDSLLSLQGADPLASVSTQAAFDPRTPRGMAIPAVDARRLHETERVESVECRLKVPHQPVSADRLHGFVQFRELDHTRLARLCERSPIYTAPAGTRLLERGQRDAWNLYLLEGSLTLTPADGTPLRVDAGTDRAARPIASLKPRMYTIDSATPVSFLWVHDLLLEAVLNDTARPAG